MKALAVICIVFFCLVPDSFSQTNLSAQEPSFDPEEGKYFIVSTVFDLTTLPKAQDRVSIFSKLSNFGRSPVGYGLSLRGFQTSIRPQLYWSAGEGDGGFYTFGAYDFKPRRRYALTLVARTGEFVSLYLQERSRKFSKEFPRGEVTSKVVFLGGYDLKGVATPTNNALFNYKVLEEAGRGTQVGVLAAFVASTEKLKDSIDKLTVSLTGAPESLAELLANSINSKEVKLWEVSSISDPSVTQSTNITE